MPDPLTDTILLEKITRETARMSFPGSMSRGKKQIVRKGAKKALEEFFVTSFPMRALSSQAQEISQQYDQWHGRRAREIGGVLKLYFGNPDNNPVVVGAKFLDTFMHQLMKYERCRPLWSQLHLALDQRIFDALRRLKSNALYPAREFLNKSPYAISYKNYVQIQNCLWELVHELNDRLTPEFKMKSRVELNWLWV
jgi:hypothetical protein